MRRNELLIRRWSIAKIRMRTTVHFVGKVMIDGPAVIHENAVKVAFDRQSLHQRQKWHKQLEVIDPSHETFEPSN